MNPIDTPTFALFDRNPSESHEKGPRSASHPGAGVVAPPTADRPSDGRTAAADVLVDDRSGHRWRAVAGYEPYYVIRDDGLLRRLDRPRRHSVRGAIYRGGLVRPRLANGCWAYPLNSPEQLDVRTRSVRKLVAEAFGDKAADRVDPVALRNLVEKLDRKI
ncbi:hypothetical protein FEZ32_11395 [Acidipropionibacterium jensenii]|uniref:hypothetical protein n=1 Tax=Acidipropionibacterium jensenii TaxID=1749 RepID=UPI00110B4443|nr:hypothetical protein [Acidipropionibacterium jensenii]QCV88872.1 hypothetical protein FEZ32_11395 [Acidipropionibacterium jensenii]